MDMTPIYAAVAIRPERYRPSFKLRARVIKAMGTVEDMAAVAQMVGTSTQETAAVTRMERCRIAISRAVNTTTIIGTTIITVTR